MVCLNASPLSIPASVNLQSEVPGYYRPLSLMLYQVMEDIGVSTEMRKLWQESAITEELLTTLRFYPVLSVYRFGSSVEGTTTENMYPDLDSVIIDNRFPVVTDCSDCHDETRFLMIQDNNGYAGYATLQLVYNGIPLSQNSLALNRIPIYSLPAQLSVCRDRQNRLTCYFSRQLWPGQERHGPATFIDIGVPITLDFVHALNCSKWPACASEWLSRKRNYNWPPPDIINKCKNLGFLLVPVGHPHSDQKNQQWRLSFSHQERLLVSLFNSVQLKCYVLLKQVKKESLRRLIKQESLSSYHCKTCMFYLIENTPRSFWLPENLFQCLFACIKLLSIWSSNGCCPNYFIPSENMFDRLSTDVQEKLSPQLHNIVSSECACLLQIQSDDIGRRLGAMLMYSGSNPASLVPDLQNKLISEFIMHLRNVWMIYAHNEFFVSRPLTDSLNSFLRKLYKTIMKYKHARRVTMHTEEETRQAIFYVLPSLEMTFMTNLIALAKQQGRSRDEIWQYLSSDIWHHLSQKSDITVKLKQASLMYMFGYYDASLDVLLSVASSLNDKWSWCTCYISTTIIVFPSPQDLVAATGGDINMTTLIRTRVPCVVFLPTEKDVTPEATCYEMLRFIDAPPGYTGDLLMGYRQECALVDGLFLFYFLLYLNHNKLQMTSNEEADISNMNWWINSRDSGNRFRCSHRDTCLNILGWVYKNEGRFDRAVECFRKSLEIEPIANAAKWHMRELTEVIARIISSWRALNII